MAAGERFVNTIEFSDCGASHADGPYAVINVQNGTEHLRPQRAPGGAFNCHERQERLTLLKNGFDFFHGTLAYRGQEDRSNGRGCSPFCMSKAATP